MEYAVVDIETTGGHASGNAITEICILVFDGSEIVDRFHSLVKPDQPIPYYITGLTGITNEMVADAPPFNQLAATVFELLQHRVFVAHNVNFDYSFIRHQLKLCGYDLKVPKLCTVRLSRKIFPGLSSYSLAKICGNRDIVIHDRHRAHGDAEATVQLFAQLLEHDTADHIPKSLKRNSKEPQLPPNLPVQEYRALPREAGVYYFLNKKGKVVYVGKARDIQQRINGHFSNNGTGAQKQHFMREVHHIRFTVCADEAAALELETREIKRLWPIYNRAQKTNSLLFGLVRYCDQNGYERMAVQKIRSRSQSPFVVHHVIEAHDLIRRLSTEFQLCQRLSGIPMAQQHCVENGCYCCEDSIVNYNLKVQAAWQEVEAMRQQPSAMAYEATPGLF
ncbi:MAG: exonuclease domain-containing protein [Chitinophagales bacterium]